MPHTALLTPTRGEYPAMPDALVEMRFLCTANADLRGGTRAGMAP